MTKLLDHLPIFSTIIFTVYSQLIMRWQVNVYTSLNGQASNRIEMIINLLLSPWVLSGIAATFLAGVSWMMAMAKFEISYAFPFVSLNYVIVLFAGYFLFGESMPGMKLVGTALVILGLIFIAKG